MGPWPVDLAATVKKNNAVAKRMVWALGLLMFVSQITGGERLPVKIYTTAEGLAHNVVYRIVRDSRGFLWFCTREGLSRFDGYTFTNYGIEQGLPSASVNDLLETREGDYWVATAGGLCRLNPLGQPRLSNNSTKTARNALFTVFLPGEDPRSRHVLALLQDRSGAIFCSTRNGLYRVQTVDGEVRFSSVELGIPDHLEARIIQCLIEDRAGTLWIGTRRGLYRRWPDGRVEAYTSRDGLPDNIIQSLLEDREGRLWVGTALGGLCRLIPDSGSARTLVSRVYSVKDGLPTTWINQLFQASDGGLWAGNSNGLVRFIPLPNGDFRLRVYDKLQGFTFGAGSLAEDRNGNLWVGTPNGGAAKIARGGFTSYGEADGLAWSSTIFESRPGDLLVAGAPSWERWFLNRFDGDRFSSIRPQFPAEFERPAFAWGWDQTVLEDRSGEWWVATGLGVVRFPKVSAVEQLAHTPPKAIYTRRNGLASDTILRLFEDSRGDIWIGSVGQGAGPSGLSRWERSTGTLTHYNEQDNLPRLDRFYVSSFAQDRAGNLWIGFSGDGGLARYHDGRFTLFTATDGVPAGQIRNLHMDSAGRLWLSSSQGGLIRIDDPAAERPQLIAYTTAERLSSNEITGVSEDQWGRIYVGTSRGIDRLEPGTGRIRHYTTADGLPLGGLNATARDRTGALWFSFQTGLARLVPQPDSPPVPPPVLITGLRVAGDSHPISVLGETEVEPIELGADKNQLQIDFVALGFSPGEGLRYQYKLEGASGEWSPLTEHRTINFANLAPGAYRFLVQAVNADDVPSERPASFSFTILTPIWQRWWFLTFATALMAGAIYLMYRYRLAQKLKVERVRTRIATDLHDDIGSSLSQIAIMSEVVRQQVGNENPRVSRPLSAIAGTSRELVDSMADIVWAINPKRDHLIDLTQRMRQFAEDLLTARHIEFTFAAPGLEGDIRIETDVRREVFLIFKEAINNTVRHSECSSVEIRFGVIDNHLKLNVSDNGGSFDAARTNGGHGLASMKHRAVSIGGELEILGQPGRGTSIRLEVPLRRRRLRRIKIST